MSTLTEFFRKYHIARAFKRKHRPCHLHGAIRRVCEECGHVFCPKCGHLHGPPPPPAPRYRPTKMLQPIWAIIKPLGALGIAMQEETGAWKMLFPPDALNTSTAGDLADQLWARPDLSALVQPTPFRAGRGTNPVHWWVSFDFKPLIQELPNDIPTA